MAIVAPVYFLLLMLMFEVGYQLLIDLALNIAVAAGSRYGITGQGYSAGTRDGGILNTGVAITAGLINPSNLTFSVASYSTPASYASGGSATASTGQSSQVVLYTCYYKAYFFTGFATSIMHAQYLTHTATFLVQNEPF